MTDVRRVNSRWPESRPVRWFVALSVLAAVALALYPRFVGPAIDSTLLMAEIAGVDLSPVDFRPPVERKASAYRIRGRQRAADLYLPGDGPEAGIVLVPGAARDGYRDRRLVEFASALARSGFAVFVPDIRSLRELRLMPSNQHDVVAALLALERVEALPEEASLGIAAFSVATGPVVLGALQASIRERLDFLLLVGGYHDLVRTLTFLTTGHYPAHGQSRAREPDSYGKWVYALSNASRLENPSDRAALAALSRRKLDRPQADVGNIAETLGEEGRAVYEFITNRDPERVPSLIRRLPESIRRDIRALDLSNKDLSLIEVRAILVHGLDDDVIPYAESLSLAGALPENQAKVYLLEGLYHVDQSFGIRDAWRLWRALYALIRERDR